MVKSKRIPCQHAAEIKAAYQIGKVRGKALLGMFPQYSKSTIYAYASEEFNSFKEADKRKNNPGRPRKLTIHDGRQIVRAVTKLRHTVGSFTSRKVQLEAGLGTQVSNRTIRRHLNKCGYKYLRSRKKGLLLKSDLRKRMRFCRKIKMRNLGSEFWQRGISMYLDGKGFQYKSNPHGEARAPKAREWRKESEGLDYGCVAKGRKEGGNKCQLYGGNCL